MIIPSIDLMGGQAVQLVGGEELAIEGGDPMAWCERFAPVGEIAVVDLDAALGRGSNEAVIQPLLERARVRLGGGIRDRETAYRWLRAGAERIVIGTAATPELLADLPADRVIVALDARDGEVVVDGWRTGTGTSIERRMEELEGLAAGYLVTLVEREGRLVGTDLERAEQLRAAAGDAELTIAGGIRSPGEVAALDALGADAQVGMALYDGSLPLAEAFAAPLRSDRPDGLWPTVVADPMGRALGLVYSSLESVREALASRSGVYCSRSRGLWRKGATSGATQRLVRVDVDCDRDTLRFTVEQSGAGFCHRDTASCWGALGGLPALERRIRSAPERGAGRSFTARLLNDPELLAAKLAEEAAELAEAVTDAGDVPTAERRAHAIWEAADLAYFQSVAMARAGITWAEVGAELDRRAGTAGGRRAVRAVTSPSGPVVDGAESGRGASGPAGKDDHPLLVTVATDDFTAERVLPFSAHVLEEARAVVDAVQREGRAAILREARRFGELPEGEDRLWLDAEQLRAAARRIPADQLALLERTRDRVRDFAEAQRATLTDLETDVELGRAGHRLLPVARAGCYAPAGRHPLPSSVIMTVVPARVAGVAHVQVATPRPGDLMLAAAHVAGADGVLPIGGAHAIAALAFGSCTDAPVDLVAGPGNAWVTAAKYLVSQHVRIDMLAGPSEVLIVADGTADPELVAADLLAQAEHDPGARPLLIAMDPDLPDAVNRCLERQLSSLSTAPTAERSLRAHGRVTVCADPARVIDLCDRTAPEHLQLSGSGVEALADRLSAYGTLFIGEHSAEVFGDYGAGPNHVLPTGGSARATAGLGVHTFLQPRTWLEADPSLVDPDSVAEYAALARLEGLAAHAHAAARRGARTPDPDPGSEVGD